MRYPLTDQDQYSGKIRFIAVEDPTVDVRTLGQYVNSYREALGEFTSPAQAAANDFAGGDIIGGEFAGAELSSEARQAIREAQSAVDTINSAISEGLTLFPPRRRSPVPQRTTRSYDFANAITLYLPQAITIGDAVEYERFDFGILGTTMAEGMRGGNRFLAAAYNSILEAGETAMDVMRGNYSGMNKELASLAAVRLAQKLPGGSDQIVRSVTGVTTNPNTKNLFKAVQLRTFTFTFKMIASSAQEAREIDSIINFFRKEMYPDLIEVNNLPLGYIFPRRFKVDLTYNGQKVPIKFLESNLLSMQTTYNPTSMGWHEDGMPSEVDMTLNFGEPRTLSKRDFMQGGELQ